MNKEYKYDAFISYRHISPDKEIADKLQRMLESYKIPSRFRTEGNAKWHIFRDETELPTSGNLSGGIQEALENSNYLIVICSPSTKSSRWCMQEITEFKRLHNGSNSKIITVLASGTPEESFPSELCTEAVALTNENGDVIYRERAIEPLAANVASDSTKKSLKKLKSEFLRIAAPLLGCGYDALYKREYRKQVRKIITVGSAVLVATLAFLAYTGAMLVKINNQRTELAASNASLTEKTRLLQIENSKILSRISEDMWLEGDGIGAVENLLPALRLSDGGNAVSPNALRVMADITGAFDTSGVKAVLNIKHKTPVKEIGYAGGGKVIVTQDSEGIYFHSADDGHLIKKYGEDELGTAYPTVYFENDGVIKSSAVKNHAVGVVLIEDDMVLGYRKVPDDEEGVSGTDVFINAKDRFLRLDGESGEITAEIKSPSDTSASFYKTNDGIVMLAKEYGSTEYAVKKYDDYGNLQGSYVLKNFDFGIYSNECLYFGKEKCYFTKDEFTLNFLYAFDIEDGEIKDPILLTEGLRDPYSLDSMGIKAAKHIDGDLITLTLESVGVLRYTAKINVYNAETAELRYSYAIADISYPDISDIGKIYAENGGNYADILYVVYGSRVVLLNSESGELVKEYAYDDKITASYCSLNGFLYIITENGDEIITPIRKISSPITDPTHFGKYKTDSSFGNHKLCAYYNNFYATAKDASHTVTVYTNAENGSYTEMLFSESTPHDVLVSPNDSYALIDNYTTMYAYDFSDNTLKLADEFEGYGAKIGFMDDTTAFSLYDGKLSIYDLTEEAVKAVSFEGDTYANPISVTDNGLIVFNNSGVITLCDKKGQCKEILISDLGDYIEEEYFSASFKSVHVEGTRLILEVSTTRLSPDYQIKARLFTYDTVSEESAYICDIAEGNSVKSVSSLDNGKCAVVFNDSSVLYFDYTSGIITENVKYDLPIMISLFYLDEENVLILSNDSCLYKVDISTGENVATLNLNDDSIKKSTNDYSEFTHIPQSNIVILGGWNGIGYVIDTQSLELVYTIEHYEEYIHKKHSVLTKQYSHVGYYPLYTIDELILKAEAYLGIKN